MEDRMPRLRKITEDTLIPISLVVTLLGGVLWLSTVWSETRANSQFILEIRTTQEKHNDFVQSVDSRLSRIEGKLGVKE